MSRYLMALDQGTTSSRAILFDREGALVAVDQHEFPQHFPKPGWVEHDPAEIWESQLRAARGVLAKAGRPRRRRGRDRHHQPARDHRGLGSAQRRARSTARSCGSRARPRRSATSCARAGSPRRSRPRTGLVIDAYFSGTKIRFILDAVPGAQQRAERGELAFGTVDSWLLHQLTRGRVHATEYSNAVAHAALQHPLARLGRPAAARARASRARCCRRCGASSGVFGVCRSRVVRRRDPDRGHRRGPAGRALRPGLHRPGPRQEHLRHRLLPADEHGPRRRRARRRVW